MSGLPSPSTSNTEEHSANGPNQYVCLAGSWTGPSTFTGTNINSRGGSSAGSAPRAPPENETMHQARAQTAAPKANHLFLMHPPRLSAVYACKNDNARLAISMTRCDVGAYFLGRLIVTLR